MVEKENYTEVILKLAGIANVLEGNLNLENGLNEVATLTAQMLNISRCSIMLLSSAEESESQEPCLRVFTHYGNLPPSAYKEVTPLNQGIAGHVAATGEPLLIKDITQSQFANSARNPSSGNNSLMSAPIFSGDQVIGTINVSSPKAKEHFDDKDLELLKLFALFVGKSIQISQLQLIMRSKFVERAMINDFADKQASLSVALNPNPTKLAKIVAKSFFRELTQAGFGPNQIIGIATEVLNLLQSTLSKHKERIARDEG